MTQFKLPSDQQYNREIIEAAEHESAPFCAFPEYKEWVRTSLASLGSELPAV